MERTRRTGEVGGAQAGHAGCEGRAGSVGCAGRAGWARGALASGAQPVRTWACCWASRLCTWCTQPVFRLSTVSESPFGHGS